MPDDAELLRRYAEERSEVAFAELVQRHLGLVYSAALRQVGGDSHHAQDVAQTVFTTLARNAASVARHPVLIGWLYTTTQHFAAKLRRTEGRRSAREHAAHFMHELTSPDSPAVEWEQLRPVLDDAMRELSDRDREAVLLRFFAQRPFAEMGATLRLSEDAARMRVERALEKLRVALTKRHIKSTTAALALALANQPAVALPASLGATVIHSALVASVAGNAAAATGLFSFMSMTQVAPAVAVIAALIAVGAATHNVRGALAAETVLATVVRENAASSARLRELARRAEAEAQQTAALQQVAAERSRAAEAAKAAPMPSPPSDDPTLRAGRELLAANPEARRLVDRIVRSSAERSYGATLRAMGLSADERERILAAAVAASESMRISFPGVTFEFGPEHPELQRDVWMRELGAENFQRFSELQRKERTNGIVKTLAIATYESDTPLLPAQTRVLSDIIEQHTTLQKTETNRMIFDVDWNAIGREAAGVLSAPQAALFTAALRQSQNAPATVKQEVPTR